MKVGDSNVAAFKSAFKAAAGARTTWQAGPVPGLKREAVEVLASAEALAAVAA